MPVAGIFLALSSVAFLGMSIYDIVSSGEWENWGILDWCFNIFTCILYCLPFIEASAKTEKNILDVLRAKLIHLPFLGRIYTFFYDFAMVWRTTLTIWFTKLFRKGGFLYHLGLSGYFVLRTLKRPWVLFFVLLGSQYFDGILQNLFLHIGNVMLTLAMAIFGVAYGAISSEKGVIDNLLVALTNYQALMPPCFSAILSALHAQSMIGMLIGVYGYLWMLKCIGAAYKMFTKVDLT